MDIDEEKFEWIYKNNDKCLSGSIRGNLEESDNKKNSLIYNVNNNNDNNSNKSSLPIINISPVHDNKITCKNVFDFTDKIYSKDEHFNKLIFNKKMSSQSNLINFKKFLSVENIFQNLDKKSATSKFDNEKKIQRKSLFHEARNKLEEEKRAINISINRSNRQSVCSKQKKFCSNKNNKFAAFLKLEVKAKKPPKVLYMDSVINKSNNLQISNSFIRKENKKQTIKSINTAKNLNENIIFTKKIVDEINKNEIEEELRKIKTKNNSISKIEDNKNQYQNNKFIETTKNEKNFQSKKCLPFQLLCCLNY